jgi:hypothetical protein
VSPPLPPSSSSEQGEAETCRASNSDSEGEETEMLSISQVLPKKSTDSDNRGSSASPVANAAAASLSINPALGAEGRPSTLYDQRYQLFETLLTFFPRDAIEPTIDLLDCIENSKLSL